MVKLRLKRLGKKQSPHYRIVATQAKTKRESESLEDLGFYSPMSKEIKVNKERVDYWLGVGAQPTKTVENLLIKEKLMEKKAYKKVYKKEPKKKSVERAQKVAEKKNVVVEEVKEEVAKEEAVKEEIVEEKKA